MYYAVYYLGKYRTRFSNSKEALDNGVFDFKVAEAFDNVEACDAYVRSMNIALSGNYEEEEADEIAAYYYY